MLSLGNKEIGHVPGSICDFYVEGTTYSPYDGGILGWSSILDRNLQTIAETVAAVCNDAGISYKGNQFRAIDLPTEAALKELRKDGFDLAESRYRELRPILDELARQEAEQKSEEDTTRLICLVQNVSTIKLDMQFQVNSLPRMQ